MPSSEHVLTFVDGRMQFVYADELSGLLQTGGEACITRASFVEPARTYLIDHDGWVADMRPSRGPLLGPFALRSDALDAERQWLTDNREL